MSGPLVWVSGASAGIGRALVATLPWEGARVIGISRRPVAGAEHLEADLADPASWEQVGASFRDELAGFAGDRVAFLHAAGTLDPIGFAGEVDAGAYAANVLVNSAAPQVLGQAFLAAARTVTVPRHLVMLTSGAATTVYGGWSAYGAGKAAVDQWVRVTGTEQDSRGGVQVLAVSPGVVATGMQELIRATPEDHFPARRRFVDLHAEGALADPHEVARAIWSLLERPLPNGSVVDRRALEADPRRPPGNG